MLGIPEKSGIVILPYIGVEAGNLEFVVKPPDHENRRKVGEKCLLIPESCFNPLGGLYEFTGGEVEDGEDVFQAAVREWTQEMHVEPPVDFVKRLKIIFEDFPIEQLRPEFVLFSVTVATFLFHEEEIRNLKTKGVKRILVNMSDGIIRDKDTYDHMRLRPAHEAIISYTARVAWSFAGIK